MAADKSYFFPTLTDFQREVGEPEDETSTHWLYICPKCKSEGKDAAKLYFSKQKMVGVCFVHNEAYVVKEMDNKARLDALSMAFQEMKNPVKEVHLQLPDLTNLKLNDLSPIGYRYLMSSKYRNPYLTKEMIDKLGMKEIRWFKNGVSHLGIFVPIYYRNLIVSYQIRFLDPIPEGWNKYYLYHATKWVYTIPGLDYTGKKIAICEGIFDAIALWSMGMYPMAVFGKTLSDSAINFIKNNQITEFSLGLDEAELNLKFHKHLKAHLPVINACEFMSFKNEQGTELDPEEYLRWYYEIQSMKVSS